MVEPSGADLSELLSTFNPDTMLMDLAMSGEDLPQFDPDPLAAYHDMLSPAVAPTSSGSLSLSLSSPVTASSYVNLQQLALAQGLDIKDPHCISLLQSLATKQEAAFLSQQLQLQQQQQLLRQQQEQQMLADMKRSLASPHTSDIESLLLSFANQRQLQTPVTTGFGGVASSSGLFSSLQPIPLGTPSSSLASPTTTTTTTTTGFGGLGAAAVHTPPPLQQSQISSELLQQLLQLQQLSSPPVQPVAPKTTILDSLNQLLSLAKQQQQEQHQQPISTSTATSPVLGLDMFSNLTDVTSGSPMLSAVGSPPLHDQEPINIASATTMPAMPLKVERVSMSPPPSTRALPASVSAMLPGTGVASPTASYNGGSSQPLSPTKPATVGGGISSIALSSMMSSGNSAGVVQPMATLPTPTEDDVEEDPMDWAPDNQSGKGKGKTVRKTSHNKIEKKYRRSINDRIQQLHKRFAGTANGKALPKSGVLQRVLDYLDKVDTENAALKESNDVLRRSHTVALGQVRNLQHQLGLSDVVSNVKMSVGPVDVTTALPTMRQQQQTISDSAIPSPIGSTTSSGIVPDFGPLTPPFSADSASPSFTGSPTALAGSPMEKPKIVTSTRGLPESSKPAYCLVIVFFATLIASPFDIVPGIDQEHMHASGRTLLAYAGVPAESHSTASFLASCMMQIIFLVLGLAWVLIHGEPFVGPGSSENVQFWRHRQQVDAYIAKGAYAQAVVQLEDCLQIIGRRLPLSRLNLYCCLVWQLMHSLLLLTGISHLVHWAVSVARYFLRLNNRQQENVNNATCKSACQAALVYHHLNCLALTGHTTYSPTLSLYIAFCSFNLAKNAGSALHREQLAEIYATLAIALHAFLPSWVPKWAISKILLRRSRSVCHPPPPLLRCLLHPDSVNFFNATTIMASDDVIWSQPTTPGRPLSAISRKLCHHLFRQTLYQLLVAHHQQATGNPSSMQVGVVYDELPQQTVATIEANLTTLRQLCHVGTCTSSSRSTVVDNVNSDVDVVSLWWCDVITSATHWLASQDEQATGLYAAVMHQPELLAKSRDPLPHAVLHCFIARKAYIGDGGETRILELCKKASGLLADSIHRNKSFDVSKDVVPNTHKLLQLLCCDWLLSTRVGVWQAKSGGGGSGGRNTGVSNSVALAAYQRDLALLQKLSHTCPIGLSQVFVYEAVSRYMAGANPQRSHYLLAKGSKLGTAMQA